MFGLFKPRAPITRRSWINLLIAVGLLAFLALYASRSGGRVTDRVEQVPSGDTLVLGATEIGLKGIAVAESGEPLGDAAKASLSELALGKTVTCALTGERAWDRIFATCTLDGQDLAKALVQAGFARDCPRQSEGRYEAFEVGGSANISLPDFCVVD